MSVTRLASSYEASLSSASYSRRHVYCSGLNGQSNRRLISMDEVKEHQNAEAMWTVLKGHVYNITPYMKFHPGGMDQCLLCSISLISYGNHFLSLSSAWLSIIPCTRWCERCIPILIIFFSTNILDAAVKSVSLPVCQLKNIQLWVWVCMLFFFASL